MHTLANSIRDIRLREMKAISQVTVAYRFVYLSSVIAISHTNSNTDNKFLIGMIMHFFILCF